MSLFTPYWTEFLRDTLPWATTFFKTVSFTGSEYFFVAIIAIGYWAYDRRLSRQVAILLLVTAVSNYWLKIIIRNPRPPSSLWLPGVTAKNYSLPSGHTQSSTVIWGWIGVKTRRKQVQIILAGLVFLVGLSRVYLGVHWLGDVLAGWIVGAFMVGVFKRFEERVFTVVDSERFDIGVAVFGALSMVGVEYLSPFGVGTNFGSLGGLMIGVGIGFLLERRYIQYERDEASLWRLFLRVVLGLGLVILVMVGLSGLLPTGVYWLRSFRYALVAVTALFIWPFLFTRLKL